MRLLALFLTLVLSASAAEVRIVRVFTGWRDAASFKRISEYFTGRENTGGQIVVRTQIADRGGYYFLVRTANSGEAFIARFRIAVVLPNSHEPRIFNFDTPLPAGQKVFNLGITGSDWPSDAEAVAWKLELLDAQGKVIATEQSYLWEKPDAN